MINDNQEHQIKELEKRLNKIQRFFWAMAFVTIAIYLGYMLIIPSLSNSGTISPIASVIILFGLVNIFAIFYLIVMSCVLSTSKGQS